MTVFWVDNMNIVILGPQGSGKGTQAAFLAKKFNLTHIETGKLLRKIAESDHPLSQQVRAIMKEGSLVSDEILQVILEQTIKNSEGSLGFVFDGTPRDVKQYDLIKSILESQGGKIDKLILLNISEEVSLKRLTSRRTCEVCGNVYNLITSPSPNGDNCECGGKLVQREDDTPESIKKRLATYHERTQAVLKKAAEDGILVEIDGERAPDLIFSDIVKEVENIYG